MMRPSLRGALPGLSDRSLWRWAAAALTVLALALLFLRTERPVTTSDRDEPGKHDRPDAFMVNVTYRTFDEQGRLSARIDSTRAEQFEDEKRVTLQSPRGVFPEKQGGAPWRLASERGQYHMDTETLTLNENVRVRHQTRQQGATRMMTETLSVDNRNRIVHTDSPVTIISASSLTKATGMTGWIDEDVVELESQVNGHYYTGNHYRQRIP